MTNGEDLSSAELHELAQGILEAKGIAEPTPTKQPSMSQRDNLLGLIGQLEKVAANSVTVAAYAAAVDRPDLQKRFQEVREYASDQSKLLYAVLGTPQQEKTDERTPADS